MREETVPVPLLPLPNTLGIEVDALRGEGEGWSAVGLGGGWGRPLSHFGLLVSIGPGVRMG
jgi:hypothetical protein